MLKIMFCFNFECDSIFDFIYIYSYWRMNNLISVFFNKYSKQSWMSDIESDLSGN